MQQWTRDTCFIKACTIHGRVPLPILLASAVLFVSTGCTSMAPQYQQPPMPVPAVWLDQAQSGIPGDNAATLSGDATLRYGWLATVGQSCDVAAQVGSLLQLRGWKDRLRACSPGCTALALRGTAA